MLTLVIVEDEHVIRKGLTYTIDWARMGCQVVGEAGNGREGLEIIGALQPDWVLTDICMPQMSGLEMLSRACELYPFYSVVLTGYAEFDYVLQAMRLNAVDYLLKPIDEGKLGQAVAKIQGLVARDRKLAALEDGGAPAADAGKITLVERAGNYYIDRALAIIRSRYHERLSLAGMAEELNVSESYLIRKFKEATSHTFLDYLNRYRLQKAIELLNEGRYRVGEIAEMTGFGQYKQLCMVFRRYIGMAPTQFARSAHILYEKPEAKDER